MLIRIVATMTALIWAVHISWASAAQPAKSKFKTLISDDFATDTRTKYKITGKVDWKKGRLEFQKGATLARAIKTGPWVKVTLRMKPIPLARDGAQTLALLEVHFNTSRGLLVAWIRTHKAGKTTGLLRVFSIGTNFLGTPQYKLIRQRTLDRDFAAGDFKLSYRYRMLDVQLARGRPLIVPVNRGLRSVQRIKFKVDLRPTELLKLRVESSPPARELSVDDSTDLATATRWNAQMLRERDVDKALALGKKAAKVRKRILGEDHPDYAQVLYNLARIHYRKSDFQLAARLYREAAQTCRLAMGESHPTYGMILSELAANLIATGELRSAAPLLIKARNIYVDAGSRAAPTYAKILANLGALNQQSGDYLRSELHFIECLQWRKKLYGESSLAYAMTLTSIGGLYRHIGDFTKSEQRLLKAKEIFEKRRRKSWEYARCLIGLGQLYHKIGSHGDPGDPTVAKTRAKALPSAEAMYLQAQAAIKDVVPADHPFYLTTVQDLATVYLEMGKYDKAEASYLKVLHQLDNKKDRNVINLATALQNLAEMYRRKGDYGKATPLYVRAQKIYASQRGRNHLLYATNLGNQAIMHMAKKEYAQAHKLYNQVCEIQFHALQNLARKASEALSLSFLDTEDPYVDPLISASLHIAGTAPADYAHVWRYRRALYRALEGRNAQLHNMGNRGSEDEKKTLRQYQTVRRQIGRLLHVQAPSRTALAALSEQKEQLERKLSVALENVPINVLARTNSPEDLIRALPDSAVFVDLVQYTRMSFDPKTKGDRGRRLQAHYVAFVCRRIGDKRLIQRVELGDVVTIDSAVNAWRTAIAGGVDDSQRSMRVSKLLWEPLRKSIRSQSPVTRLYLCPDATLAKVPWGAIPVGRGRVLLDDFQIATVPHGPFLSQRLLRKKNESVSKIGDEQVLLVGEVAYGKPPAGGSNVRWRELKGTADEIRQISALSNKRRVVSLTGSAANVAQVLSGLSRSNVAHLATHGLFADTTMRRNNRADQSLYRAKDSVGKIGRRATIAGRNPLVLSSLVLAGANNGPELTKNGMPSGDGGVLSAEAIAGLQLGKLKTVVLSACETAVGESASHEGVYGLQRAFHIAGVENVIASLWKIDDKATAALMKLFYYQMWHEGKPPIEAIRQAQLAIANHPGSIRDLSTSRGPAFAKTVKIVRGKPATNSKRTPTKLWAAFTLSGVGH